MDKTGIIKGIIEDLDNSSSAIRQEKSETYFPTSMKVYGVSNPDLQKIINNWGAEIKKMGDRGQVDLSIELVNTGIFECQLVAYDLLWRNKNNLKLLGKEEVEELGKNIDNWGTTDAFSILISGQAWRQGQVSDEVILKWVSSENRWWRRAAVVSTVALNLKSRGGKGDVRRTLMICEKVVKDRDDMVAKALSWALRELSKREKSIVGDFIGRYRAILPGRVIREVTNKLETGKKNR